MGVYNPLLKTYPDSEKINAVSEGAEVLYIRLLAQSDDAHRYYGDGKRVLAKLFLERMMRGQLTEHDIESRLAELENVGLIERYEVRGTRYLELVKCFKTFRKDVNPTILFPARNGDVTDAGRTRDGDVVTDQTRPDQTRPAAAAQNSAAAAAEICQDALDPEAFRVAYRRIASVVPTYQNDTPRVARATHEFCLRVACLFVSGAIPLDFLDDALDSMWKRPPGDPVRKPRKYLTNTLEGKCVAAQTPIPFAALVASVVPSMGALERPVPSGSAVPSAAPVERIKPEEYKPMAEELKRRKAEVNK